MAGADGAFPRRRNGEFRFWDHREFRRPGDLRIRQKYSCSGPLAANADSGEHSNESPAIRIDGVSQLVQTISQTPAQRLAAG
ncbi:hypothetical protein SAMN05216371_7763 [Streptomyces sp. TLI_053]|nr:hypothetical protein SAMN05216371_7763 [Streptomyces sp. TLI_053]